MTTHISIDIEEGTARAESGGGAVLVPLDPVLARVQVPGLPGPPGAGFDQGAADARYVNTSGDTMTGGLTVAGPLTVDDPLGIVAHRVTLAQEPTDDAEAATKGYVDTGLAAHNHSGHYLPISGGMLTGALTVNGDLVVEWMQSQYGIDTGGYKVTSLGDPTDDFDGANKRYVDSRIWKGTQAAYDAIAVKDPNVLYCVKG